MQDPTDIRTQVRDFLVTRRNRLTPEAAGLPIYGGNRRVPGLRREEVALLAGMSVDYHVRLERGSLNGASDSEPICSAVPSTRPCSTLHSSPSEGRSTPKAPVAGHASPFP